ncbi:uncharacterized protein H6S33_011064 [Morchella sextelata]|uniref:uncharacterized protein n=1 Tax=Morchella sextelata TaxID=1174677 RepID=UPI001D052462|nr:uncharacterized protein H6S33_011064 [Morchella sextelata]KAH0611799.1 hypothetical protein H6S33_011064 [Morchella sextelata]
MSCMALALGESIFLSGGITTAIRLDIDGRPGCLTLIKGNRYLISRYLGAAGTLPCSILGAVLEHSSRRTIRSHPGGLAPTILYSPLSSSAAGERKDNEKDNPPPPQAPCVNFFMHRTIRVKMIKHLGGFCPLQAWFPVKRAPISKKRFISAVELGFGGRPEVVFSLFLLPCLEVRDYHSVRARTATSGTSGKGISADLASPRAHPSELSASPHISPKISESSPKTTVSGFMGKFKDLMSGLLVFIFPFRAMTQIVPPYCLLCNFFGQINGKRGTKYDHCYNTAAASCIACTFYTVQTSLFLYPDLHNSKQASTPSGRVSTPGINLVEEDRVERVFVLITDILCILGRS